jgi:hypothetical protein
MPNPVAGSPQAATAGTPTVVGDGIGSPSARGFQQAFDMHNYLRPLDDFRACFEGLQVVEPDLVPVNTWQPAVARHS